MQQRGFIIGIVLFAVLALSIAGTSILVLSGSEADMAGQLRRQRQVQACAAAGGDATVAKLPTVDTALSLQLDSTYTAASGHFTGGAAHTPMQSTAGVVSPTLVSDLPLRNSGENLVNVPRVTGLGTGAAGVTRQPYRFVTHCNGGQQQAESERIILYGAGR